jgi:site-specific DNA recombinase
VDQPRCEDRGVGHRLARHRPALARPLVTETEIKSIATKLAGIARVPADADPADKAELFRQLGLKLTYHPGTRVVEAEIGSAPLWVIRECPRSVCTQKANTWYLC